MMMDGGGAVGAGLPDCVVLRLGGGGLPGRVAALRVGLRVRAAVMGHAGRLFGEGRVPAVLSGHQEGADGGSLRAEGHGHAYYLPLDCDGDGALETVVVSARSGFDRVAVAVLTTLPEVRAGGLGRWEVACVYLGDRRGAPVPVAGPAVRWRSVTPFFNPFRRHRKDLKPNPAEEQRYQLGLMLGRLGYPPTEVSGLARPPAHSLAPGLAPGPAPATRPDQESDEKLMPTGAEYLIDDGLTQRSTPDRVGGWWELGFERPVTGPVALGFGSHFGLGLFLPAG